MGLAYRFSICVVFFHQVWQKYGTINGFSVIGQIFAAVGVDRRISGAVSVNLFIKATSCFFEPIIRSD